MSISKKRRKEIEDKWQLMSTSDFASDPQALFYLRKTKEALDKTIKGAPVNKDKLEEISTRRDSRIDFSHKGKRFSINVNNNNELRISVEKDLLVIIPTASNSIVIENRRWDE